MVKKSRSLVVSQVLRNNAKNRRLGPILLDFPHGPCLNKNLCETKPHVDLSMLGWNEDKNLASYKLRLSTTSLTYSNNPDQESDKYFNTYLAIRDKATGKVRLVETRQSLLKPEVDEPKTTNPILLSEFSGESKEERMEASRHLVKSFGQKKGQRMFENYDKFNVDRAEADAKVAKAAGAVNIESLSQLTPTLPKVELVPPRDETATRPEHIYRVEHFLTTDETVDLQAAAQNLLEEYNSAELVDQGVARREFSAVGAHFIKRFLNQSGEMGKSAAVALYMEAIIKFTKLKPGDITKGYGALQKFLPLPIKKKVFQLFTFESGGKRIVTPELKDKAICYIIALALIINSCKIELSLLTESVRVDQTKMKKLVLVTGAHLEVGEHTREHTVILRKQLARFDVNYVGKKKRKM